MDLILATRNPGKVAELAARLADLPVHLVSAAEVPGAPEVDEDADTLRGNAEKKARALFAHTGRPALADDTGLEVDGLGGAPGVHSARYAGPEADDTANRAKLLTALAGEADRRARFRTVLAFTDDTGTRFFDGVCEGTITTEEIGDGGFGYDALFRPADGDGRTFAQMDKAEKNRISHRGRALDRFAAFLHERLDGRMEPSSPGGGAPAGGGGGPAGRSGIPPQSLRDSPPEGAGGRGPGNQNQTAG